MAILDVCSRVDCAKVGIENDAENIEAPAES